MTDKPDTFLTRAPESDQPYPQTREAPLIIPLFEHLREGFEDEMRTLDLQPSSIQKENRGGEPYIVYSFAPDSISPKEKTTLLELSEKYGINQQKTLEEVSEKRIERTVAEVAERRAIEHNKPNASGTTVNYERVYKGNFTVVFPEDGLKRLNFETELADFFSGLDKDFFDTRGQSRYFDVKTKNGKTSFDFHIPVMVPANEQPASVIARQYGDNFSIIKNMAKAHSGTIYIAGAPATFIQ